MKILIDPQIFWYQKFGGISRYFAELIDGFSSQEGVEVECPLLINRKNLHLKEKGLLSYPRRIFLEKRFPRIFRRIFKNDLQYAIERIKRNDFDVFLSSYYDPYFIDIIDPQKLIPTIYDMIHERYPDLAKADPTVVENKRKIVSSSRHIIAISENTKSDLQEYNHGLDPDKISVVYLSQSIEEIESSFDRSGYILFVGNRRFYKNFDFLLKSFRSLVNQHPDQQLLCAGGGPFTKSEIDDIKELDLVKNVSQYDFEDNELYSIYSKASFFIFPSEYEGFGIPILEAMKCGCPVVIPYHSSFPEVAMNAALYYNTNDSQDLYEKMNLLLDEPSRREKLIQDGLNRAKEFSWQKTTMEILDICKTVLPNA